MSTIPNEIKSAVPHFQTNYFVVLSAEKRGKKKKTKMNPGQKMQPTKGKNSPHNFRVCFCKIADSLLSNYVTFPFFCERDAVVGAIYIDIRTYNAT